MSDHDKSECKRTVRASEDRDRYTGVVWSWVDEVRYCGEHSGVSS